ncbi:MAG TPA: S8 family serine peptidase [Gaiellaceae bacterium]|nr:S8 family serine peptidase [Gaiellaceae bacterium]
MRRRTLRLAVTLLCAAGLAAAPGSAGVGGGGGPLGGALNETATKWFVELASPPASKGTSKATLKAERDAFKANAAAEGVRVTERYAFDSLWNGLSVSVDPSQVAALGSVPGVKAVYPVVRMSLPPSETPGNSNADLKNAVGLTGANIAQDELGLDGSGVTIAIMDSGLDYTLPEFGGCFGPGCKVRGGYDFVGDTYNTTTTSPAFQPVPHPDGNPLPCDPDAADHAEVLGAGTSDAAHGTHVAGIAAADGRGHTAEGQVVGVAPGAQLLAYRVFGCNGGTDSDVMVQAMERALADHADVLNMSIGAAFVNWPQYPTAVAADNLASAGVTVVASIGNSGANGGQLWSAGAPGVGRNVIGVAAFDNTKATLPAFRMGSSTLYMYNRASGSLATVPQSGGGEVVAVGTPSTANAGCVAPLSSALSGKIALIRRGTCGFYNKAINAQRAGAIGVLLYNNAPGALSPTVVPVPAGSDPVTIPVAALTAADGAAIYGALATVHTLTWTDQVLETPLATAGLSSDFSSFGTDAELGLKPDLGAPGGQIYSTWPHQQFGGHNTIGGTSMAAPHVAGLAALLLQAKDKRISPATVRTLLMNTALPRGLNVFPGAGLEPTWRQGAGLAQIVDAISTPAWVTPSKLSLGEGSGGDGQLTITNGGSTPVTYDLSEVTTIGTGPSTAAGAVYPFNFSYLGGANTATFSSASVTVPAGGSASVGVSIQPGAWRDKSLYGGYVVLTPRAGGVTLRVPYVGFMGDYQSLPVLTSAGCGLPAVFQLRAGSSDACLGPGVSRLGAGGATFTLQGSDIPIMLFHLNHQVRRLNVQVYKADGAPVHPVFDYVTQQDFLGRNSTATGMFEFDWDGTRSQDNGGGNGDHRKVVPNGRYVLKLSVLKALGNAGNPADWETFTTPPITLARP